ncbi:helix-turn-helix domain-containing protein [Verticiella sediminum]|uniref:Helix-turn-helix domain-containing protein n=1 Tax=Verticiella sediminum TaxID=1247510 RepID=A0A556ABY5_9BURK|nr:helix-turn-helix domain-containing protein [Verticiella sediminum]TSH90402.1 helix-turn-helix domain-containing protein [Verticiella sediminum]
MTGGLTGEALKAARDHFLAGGSVPAELLPPAVARSWQRSRDAGLMPWQAPYYAPLGTDARTRDDRRLARCVADEAEHLWSAFGGPDWTILCTNAAGVIVHARRSAHSRERRFGPIVAGRRIEERAIGTTAPACVLAEAAADAGPVEVHAGQHYLDEFADFFCLAVPIHGLDGDVAGALDITGVGRRDPVQLREHFHLAALAVEHRLLATLERCHLLRLQPDPRWLPTPLAGVLAVTDDGDVRAASRAARQMLGLPARGRLALDAATALFPAASPGQRLGLLRPAPRPLRLPAIDGTHLWVQYARAPLARAQPRVRTAVNAPLPTAADSPAAVAEPARAQPACTASAPPAPGALHEHALRAVREALREHRGNVAAAACQLGVSRTTVYAHLRRAGLRPDAGGAGNDDRD